MLIYVCSPLRGDIEKNVHNARLHCKYVIDHGHIPIAPHVMFNGVLDDTKPEERAKGIALGLQLLDICNELWVFGDTISDGMSNEIYIARITGKKVEYVQES